MIKPLGMNQPPDTKIVHTKSGWSPGMNKPAKKNEFVNTHFFQE